MSTPCPCLFLVSLLLLLAVPGPGRCQWYPDPELVARELSEKHAYRTALRENPDTLDLVTEATLELDRLWTQHLSEAESDSDSIPPLSLTPQCNKSVSEIKADLNKAAPLLDASGKQGPGLLEGNFIIDGAFDECFDYNYTAYCTGKVTLSNLKPTPIGEYLWTVSLCVPRGCTPSDVAQVMNNTGIFDVNAAKMSCSDHKEQGYDVGAIVMLWVCGLFVCLVLVGTLVDRISTLVASWGEGGGRGGNEVVTINGNSGISGSGEKIPLLANTMVKVEHKGCCKVSPLDFLTAFSLYKTVPTLLATKQAPGVITSLNGVRVVSMFWVILGHAYIWIMRQRVDDPLELISVSSRLTFQPIGNSFLAVDSFFFLSGVLVAYLTFRQIKRTGRFPFLHYYLHRYLRLTPAYAFMLFFAWYLAHHIVPAPMFTSGSPYEAKCSQYWWTNFLYINNLYPWRMTDECMGWTWYLANDMQFFVIAPLVLLPLYYLFPLGMLVTGLLLVVSFAITGTLVGVYDFQADFFASLYAYHHIPTNKTSYTVYDMIYVKPWCRIAPYLVGLLMGYVFFKGVRLSLGGRLKNACLYLVVWVCSGMLLVSTCYGLYFTWHGHVPTTTENIIYITFSRFAWTLGLALLVYACHSGYGGMINTFLSLKIWTPLSRLTYNAYLVHPVVLTVIYQQMQKTLHYTDITVASLTVAFVMFSYAIAAVLFVCVEFPLGSVELLLFKLAGLGTGRESQRHGGGGGDGGGEERGGRLRGAKAFTQGKV